MRAIYLLVSALFIYIALAWWGGLPSDIASQQVEVTTEHNTSSTHLNSTKKGVAFSYSVSRWPEFIAKLSPYWHYHWGDIKSIYQPDGIEFVPMIWGKIKPDSESIDSLTQRYDLGEFNFLLGFNEPDKENQSNMSIDDVIAQWPLLESIGAPLVSPSPVNVQNSWMQVFMETAQAKGLRIDYLGFHWYGGANAEAFLNRVDQAYEKFGIPIWITEFAVADWNAKNSSDNRWSDTEVLMFMKTVLPELDKRSYVYRYAWFNGETPQLISSKLIDRSGTLTKLGEFYATYKANKHITLPDELPVIDNMDNNLLDNGNFESRISGEWKVINGKVATLNNTHIAEGYRAYQLRPGYSELSQSAQLPVSTTKYALVLMTKCEGKENKPALLTIKGNLNSYYQLKLGCSPYWSKQSFEFTSYEGEQITLAISKENTERFYIDDIKLMNSH